MHGQDLVEISLRAMILNLKLRNIILNYLGNRDRCTDENTEDCGCRSERRVDIHSNMLNWETRIDTRFALRLLTLQPLSPMHEFRELNLGTMRTDDMNNSRQV